MRDSRNKLRNEGEEIGLFAGGFKGKCHNCGRYGHKKADCKEAKKVGGWKGQRGGQRLFCIYCIERDHTVENCPKVKEREERLARERRERGYYIRDEDSSDDSVGLVLICTDNLALESVADMRERF